MADPSYRVEPGVEVAPCDVFDLTLSLDTGGAYADADVLADTQEIANVFRLPGGTIWLQNIRIVDEDDQGAALDLIFLDAASSLGTENSAVSISDALSRTELWRVSVASGDYYDQGGSRIACIGSIATLLKAASGSTSLFVAAVSRGTGTYTAAGIRLKIGVQKN